MPSTTPWFLRARLKTRQLMLLIAIGDEGNIHRAAEVVNMSQPAASKLLKDLEDVLGISLFERLHQPFLLWWGTPEQEFLNRLLREDLVRSIEALPELYRIVVVMADVQGFPYGEIACALEIPVGTVRSRLARGRALLQKALWEHACDAGLRIGALEERPGHA